MTEPHPLHQPTDHPPSPVGGPGRDVLGAQAAWLEREQPAHLVAALGRPGSSEWRALALEIERYRRASGVTSRASTLGASPDSAEGAAQWRRLADRIAQHQGVRTITFDDLCVFPAEAARKQDHLSLLDDRRWFGVLSPREIQTIIPLPTLVLRRHVTYAVRLLTKRPGNGPARLPAVEADRSEVRAYQAAHEAAVQQAAARLQAVRGQPAQEVAGERRRLEATIQVHRAALARLAVERRRLDHQRRQVRQAIKHQQRWDGHRQLPLAIGLHSAYELARRELELLIALEHEPPAYLLRELGTVPSAEQGRVAWHKGVRLIERYRAEHNIADATAALGPHPSGYLASHARQETAERLEAVRVEIHRSVVVRSGHTPDEVPPIDMEPI